MRSSNTCDMYMCRLRHINVSVLLSLKMEGIRLPFYRRFGTMYWPQLQGSRILTHPASFIPEDNGIIF
jgi:hypothetical protein